MPPKKRGSKSLSVKPKQKRTTGKNVKSTDQDKVVKKESLQEIYFNCLPKLENMPYYKKDYPQPSQSEPNNTPDFVNQTIPLEPNNAPDFVTITLDSPEEIDLTSDYNPIEDDPLKGTEGAETSTNLPATPIPSASSSSIAEVPIELIEEPPKSSLTLLKERYSHVSLCMTPSGLVYTKCPACCAIFYEAKRFHDHLFSHIYMSMNNVLFACIYCRYANLSLDKMILHLRSHVNQCQICYVDLSNKTVYSRHLKASQMEFVLERDQLTKYKCTACGMCFDLAYQAQKHGFKHTCRFSMTYQCQSCGGIFPGKDDLSVHRCLSCPTCDKVFSNIKRLKCHARHENHLLKCSTCSYEFILKVDYDNHMLLHNQTKFIPHPEYRNCMVSKDCSQEYHKCNICGKICKTLKAMITHLEIDHRINEMDEAEMQMNFIKLEPMF